jgi:hypothetical protein
MKKIIFILVCFTSIDTLTAQMLDFGLKAGLNFSEMSNNNSSYLATSNATGFVAGTYGRIGVLGFFAQPEILFSQRKGAFTSNMDQTAVINTMSYIDTPVLVGFKLLFFRANVGPNFQFLVNAKQEASTLARDPDFSKDNYKSSAVGYQAGIGVDLLKLSLDLRYDGSFRTTGNTITTNTGVIKDYSTRASMWQLTLGFKLF